MNLFNIGGDRKDEVFPPHAAENPNFSNQSQTVEEDLKGISLFYEELAVIYGLEQGDNLNPDMVIKKIYELGHTYRTVLDKLAAYYKLSIEPETEPKYEDILKAKQLKDKEKERKEKEN